MYIDLDIGDDVIDSDGFCCKVVNIKKTNLGMSVEIYGLKKTKSGINTTQWYWVDKFFKERFKWGLTGYLEFINKSSYETIKTYFRTKKIIFG